VNEAWEELTRPENLEALEAWNSEEMNPFAAQASQKALEECLDRSRSK